MDRAILSAVCVITVGIAGYFMFNRLSQTVWAAEHRLRLAIEGNKFSRQRLDQRIDEASNDSFPASDPPAHRTVAATRGPL